MRNLFSTTKHFIKVLCCFSYLLFNKLSFCQTNLVPNQSFELYTICPNNSNTVNTKFSKPDIWYKPDIHGAVYYNRCTNKQPNDGVPYNFGGGGVNYQEPRTGDAYLAMFYYNQDANNYIQIKLLDSLQKAKKYYCEYYVSLLNTFLKGCNNIAMLFTKNVVYADTSVKNIFLANPQVVGYGNPVITDTMDWVKISGIFTAQGGEQYLTLGNFKLASQTQFIQIQPFPSYNGSAYYVDDVAVYALDSFCLKADAGRDTTITLGDSVFIGSYTNGLDSVKWFVNGTTLIDSIRPGFWAKPTVTTNYVLQQTINGCFSADTVVVNVNPLPLTMLGFTVMYQPTPNPSKEGNVLLQWQTANEMNVSHFNIQRSTNGKDFINIGQVKAQNKQQNNYIYNNELTPNTQPQTMYYRLQSIDKDGKKQYSATQQITIKPQTTNSVSIFPNPAKDFINIACKDGIKEVKLLDIMGRQISRFTRNDSNVSNTLLWRVGEAKGLYLLKITTTKNIEYNEKLLVQ